MYLGNFLPPTSDSVSLVRVGLACGVYWQVFGDISAVRELAEVVGLCKSNEAILLEVRRACRLRRAKGPHSIFAHAARHLF